MSVSPARTERIAAVAEPLAGATSILFVASLNGWGAGEQTVAAAALVLGAATAAAPASRRSWMAIGWIGLVLVLILGLAPASAAASAGVVVAATIAAAITVRRPLALRESLPLVIAWPVALALVPFRGIHVAGILIAVISAAVLWYSLLEQRRIHPAALALVLLVSAVALPVPFEAAILPAILGAAILAARTRSLIWCGLAVVAALLAGKWVALPVAVLCAAALASGRASRLPVTPMLAAMPGGNGLPSAALHFAAWPLWRSASLPGMAGAALLLAGALMIERVWIALVWVICAMFVLWLTPRVDPHHGAEITLPALVALVSVGFGWSGAIASAVPLPASLLLVAGCVVAVSLLPLRSAVAGAASIALFLIAALPFVQPAETMDWRIVERSLAPGESYVLRLDAPRAVELVLRGANVTALEPEMEIVNAEALVGNGGQKSTLSAERLGDWGSLRNDTIFSARLSEPGRREPLIGLGRESFFRYATTLRLGEDPGTSLVRLTVNPDLPPDVRVVIESVRTWQPSR